MINKIFNSCDSSSIPVGMHILDPSINELKKKIDQGFRFIAYSIDSIFLFKSSNNPVKNF